MGELAPLYPVSREHFNTLSDETGIMQHAIGRRPDPAHGYCTDDVARGLLVDLVHLPELGWQAVDVSVRRSLRFLVDAFDPALGRFRNCRGSDGRWLDSTRSQDAHARAILALGELIARAPQGTLRDVAIQRRRSGDEEPQPAAEALAAFGVAAEDAAKEAKGPGSFHAALYDALYNLDPTTLDGRAFIS